MKWHGHTIFAFFRGVRPFIRRFSPLFVVLAIVISSFGSAVLLSQPSYAAPEDFDTKEKCEDNEFTWDDATKKCTDPNATSCNVEGVGWIVCPVMTFLGNVGDTAFGFLADNFLSTNVAYFGPDPTTGESSVERAWNVMRTLANIAFVIAFMVIIYSQLTSTGVSNYGVKKMLPRLIIAAILVNASYIICQLAIDVSNVLGYGLKQLFDSIGGLIQPSIDPAAPPPADGSWAAVIGGLLAGGVTLWFTLGGGLILTAVVALLLVAFILVARIALIIILTVVSPLAFVAFLLPNTEQWFKKWYKMFFALLLVFPIIAVVFGASSMIAEVINNTAAGPDDWKVRLTALAVASIPTLAVPSLLQNAIKSAGDIGTKLAGMASKRQAAIGSQARANASKGRSGDLVRGIQRSSALRRAKRRTGRVGSWLDNSALGRAAGWDTGAAAATATVDKSIREDIENERNQVAGLNKGELKAAYDKASNAKKAAIMERLITIADPPDYKDMVDGIGHNKSKDRSVVALRQSTAKALADHGPQFLKASNHDAISSGTMGTNESIDDMARANITAGIYSQERMVSENSGNLKYAREVLADGDTTMQQTLGNTARDLQENPNLSGKIKHNREQIEEMAKNAAPRATPTSIPAGTSGGTTGSASSTGGSTSGGGSSGGSSTPPAPSSGDGGSSGAPVPSGWEEHPSGLVVPHGTTSSPAAAPTVTPAAAPAASAPAQTNQEIEAAQEAAESRPKIVDKRGGDRPSFFGSKSSPAPRPGSTTDAAGRQTPASASEDYHDRMSK